MINTQQVRSPISTSVSAGTGAPGGDGRPATPQDDGGGTEVRLALSGATSAAATTLDGAWWPRSRNLSAELPGLIARLHQLGVRITRVTYNPRYWDTVAPEPRRLAAGGRIIRLGWFASIDPYLLSLTDAYGSKRLDLLVVPPGASVSAAERAIEAAAGRASRHTPTEVLRAAGALPTASPPRSPTRSPASRRASPQASSADGAFGEMGPGGWADLTPVADWETDGGRVGAP